MKPRISTDVGYRSTMKEGWSRLDDIERFALLDYWVRQSFQNPRRDVRAEAIARLQAYAEMRADEADELESVVQKYRQKDSELESVEPDPLQVEPGKDGGR